MNGRTGGKRPVVEMMVLIENLIDERRGFVYKTKLLVFIEKLKLEIYY